MGLTRVKFGTLATFEQPNCVFPSFNENDAMQQSFCKKTGNRALRYAKIWNKFNHTVFRLDNVKDMIIEQKGNSFPSYCKE